MVPAKPTPDRPVEVHSPRRLKPRSPENHKGDFGQAVLIGGSAGMSGAIALAGMAALRGGAGLVRLAVPRDSQQTVASLEPAYMTVGLPVDAEGRISIAAKDSIDTLLNVASAVACGPGLGRSEELKELVGWLYRHAACASVFDADALNALADQREILKHHGGPRILTPHPGEFTRLSGRKYNADPVQRRNDCIDFAHRSGTTVVLKGHQTCVSDGRQIAINQTGNPGMATGGTGDVLTGVITALLCQGLKPFDAAFLGVHVHGLAGDLAAKQLGQVSLIATDLIGYLPAAFQQVQSTQTGE